MVALERQAPIELARKERELVEIAGAAHVRRPRHTADDPLRAEATSL